MKINVDRVNRAATALAEAIQERVEKGGFIDYPYLAWIENKLKDAGMVDPCLQSRLAGIEDPFQRVVVAKEYLGASTFKRVIRQPLSVWQRCIFDYLGSATFAIGYALGGYQITRWYCSNFSLDPELMRGFNRDEFLETISLAWVGSILGKPQ